MALAHPERDSKIGFNIGWDYYAYDFLFPAYFQSEEYKSIQDGYNEARARRIPKHANNRYIKKWLQLRANAWKRNRYFDEGITPEYIKHIDTKHCPITGIALTHGTGELSDWSVDRVNNNAAYAVGNIIVVSTRANICKMDYSYLDIINFAYGSQPIIPDVDDYPMQKDLVPLDKIEWSRWALICSHACYDEDDECGKAALFAAPCVIYPPYGLRGRLFTLLQILIARKASHYDAGEIKQMLPLMRKPNRREMNEIIKQAEKMRARKALEVWYNDRLFIRYLNFYSSLDASEHHLLSNRAIRMFAEHENSIKAASLNLASKGFAC